jgi:hypothetical protein
MQQQTHRISSQVLSSILRTTFSPTLKQQTCASKTPSTTTIFHELHFQKGFHSQITMK